MVPLENRELYHERGAGQHHPLLRHHDQEGLHSQGGIKAVFRIRIHVFFGLPDPDPLVRGMNPDLDPDPSIIMQK
jgi:hypothetical protein